MLHAPQSIKLDKKHQMFIGKDTFMQQTTHRNNKTIIHIVQHLAPGGIETLALSLLQFARPGDRVWIISLEGDRQTALNKWPRLKDHRGRILFLGKNPGLRPGLIIALFRLFKVIRPDVVHTHHIGPLFYAGFAARIAGVPIRIHTEHDAWHLEKTKRKTLQRWVLKVVQPTVVAVATYVKTQLDTLCGYPKTTVIKNGVDCNTFKPGSQKLARQNFNLPENKRIVGCAGRLVKLKGHEYLIRSLPLLPEEIILVIAGDGPERQTLTALTHTLNISERVVFLGQVEPMPKFYQALDVFCMPSLLEGLPLSLLEAQGCNIPVVATRVGASAEAVCPETGQLINPGDIPETVEALHQAFSRPDKTESETTDLPSSAKIPREFVIEHYEIRKMAKAYRDLAIGDPA
jgi:glycosyltransferase involved in cell wall biosynthesis